MLASQQYQQLISILSEEEAKFEDLLKRFTEHFQKAEYFRVGWIIQHLIQQDVYIVFTI